MSSHAEKDGLASWIYLGVMMFTLIPVLGVYYSIGIFLTVFREYFNESHSKTGWIGAIFYFFSCGYPLFVLLHRRLGLRPVTLCAAAVIIYACVTTPLVPTLNFLFLTFSIPFGISTGFLDCVSIITLREYFDEYLGVATGLRSAAVATGGVVFNYLLPILIDTIGWKKTFFALTSLGAVFLVYAMAYRSPISRKETFDVISAKEQEIEAAVKVPGKSTPSYEFLRNRGFLLFTCGNLVFTFVIMIPPMFMIQYAKTLGYPLSESKWMIVVHSLSSLFGRAGVGRIADIAMRYRKVKYIPPVAITLFGTSTGLCLLTQTLPLMILYMAFIGCLEGIYWVTLPLMMIEVFSGKHKDYAYAFLVCVSSLGYLSGPPTMGRLYDVTGNFRNVLYAVSACAMVAGVITMIASWMTSKGDHSFTEAGMEDVMDSLITKELNNFKLLGMTKIPVLADKITIVEKVSVV